MNIFLENFHFIRPLWLLAAIPGIILFLALWFIRSRSSGWNKTINSTLLPHLLDGTHNRHQGWPLFIVLLAWLLSCVSLAGPAWEKLPQPVQKKEDALVIIQDLSLSFYTQDLSPNRLTKAQHKLIDLLKQRKEGTTALVVYSGDAHVVSPLTDDSKTIESMVPSLSPGIMPSYGSNIEDAVEHALQLLKDAGVSRGKLFLLTDEVEEEDAKEVSKLLRGKNATLLILGIGTTDGGPIPKDDGGFLKDDAGNIIVPRLNRHFLQELARNNGGRYSDIQLDDRDIEYLLAAEAMLPDENEYRQFDREFDQWQDMGPWLLLFVLPLALLAFRKGWILVFIFIINFSSGRECYAFSWLDLWQRKDQQAAKTLNDNDPAKAAELFQSPAWKGVAEYKAENFSAAVDAFKQNETAENYYNMGNALARAGSLDEAIKAYDKALKQKPDMEDAQFNRQLLKHLKQQQQEKQNQNNSQNQNSDEKKQQQSDQQDQTEQQPQEQGQEGQDQKQQNQEQNAQESQENDPKAGQGDEQQTNEKKNTDTASEQQEGEPEKNDPEQNVKQKAQDKSQEIDADQQQTGITMQMDEEEMTDEEKQALEQWLRQVPDNPGGLLRRKFEYESRINKDQQKTRNNKIW